MNKFAMAGAVAVLSLGGIAWWIQGKQPAQLNALAPTLGDVSPAQALFDRGAELLQKGQRKEGCQLYLESAEKGLVIGHLGVGLCYNEGDGWEQNSRKALEHMQIAANAQLAPAQFMLGNFYAQGTGVEKDEAKAVEWYQKAAAQGNHLAQFGLGRLFAAKNDQPAHAKAFQYFSEAAAADYAPAQYELAILYGSGKGVGADPAKAREWYEKAAAAQYSPAQYNLALMYAKGDGTKKDQKAATKWMGEAAKNGFEKAQEVLVVWEKENKAQKN